MTTANIDDLLHYRVNCPFVGGLCRQEGDCAKCGLLPSNIVWTCIKCSVQLNIETHPFYSPGKCLICDAMSVARLASVFSQSED